MPQSAKRRWSQKGWCNKPTASQFQWIFHTDNLMLSWRDESTEVDRRTWQHVPSRTLLSTSNDSHQVVEIQKETSTKMYTPFELLTCIQAFLKRCAIYMYMYIIVIFLCNIYMSIFLRIWVFRAIGWSYSATFGLT